MITERAKSGLDELMKRCLNESLSSPAYPEWSVSPVADMNEIKQKQFVMLTVSSYDFRMVVLLHFTRGAASIKYVADTLQQVPNAIEEARYYDYLAEVGNTFCGAFKRELGNVIPHLGMSTPNLLFAESLDFVKTWPVEFETHMKAEADDDTCFYGSLYVSSYGDLDFDPQGIAAAAEEVETGALELF